MRTLIIVPTHNEAENITELLDRIAHHVPDAHVAVVDDGSSDGTGRIVAARAADDDR
ncbi:MAG: glycosyltransferase, partial [Ilumatobacteraceae bacterium]